MGSLVSNLQAIKVCYFSSVCTYVTPYVKVFSDISGRYTGGMPKIKCIISILIALNNDNMTLITILFDGAAPIILALTRKRIRNLKKKDFKYGIK